MSYQQIVIELTNEGTEPCVSISLNTHRTHPDNEADRIVLKNLVKEAENKLSEYPDEKVTNIHGLLRKVEQEIDHNKNLDSLHVFVSGNSKKIFRSPWPAHDNTVTVGDHFNLIPLIKVFNESENFYVLVLSQGGAQVFEALNKNITGEVKNDHFPFAETGYYPENAKRASDAEYVDNLLKNYLNKVDKAAVELNNETGLKFIVVSTADNFNLLQEVADDASVYIGHSDKDYNQQSPHDIIEPAWEIVESNQKKMMDETLDQLREDAGKNLIVTDTEKIDQAAIEGKGEFLFISEDYLETSPEIEKINSLITQILSKNGWVYLTRNEEITKMGDLVLKTRY